MFTLIQSGCTEEDEGGGTVGAASRLYTHHDNASRLLSCAHAHDGRHANCGALEVYTAAKSKGQMLGEEEIKTAEAKSEKDLTTLMDYWVGHQCKISYIRENG